METQVELSTMSISKQGELRLERQRWAVCIGRTAAHEVLMELKIKSMKNPLILEIHEVANPLNQGDDAHGRKEAEKENFK